VVQNRDVKLINQMPHAPRTLTVGRYCRAAQHLVPDAEAPIRDLRSPTGWRVIVSAVLDHNEGGAALRLRFFDPHGTPSIAHDVLYALMQDEIGRLFGGTDDIFAITTIEEHAYNAQTEIWLLPEQGAPTRLLSFSGVFERFVHRDIKGIPGVKVSRQTYDGVHAETKGTVRQFYAWNDRIKSLTLRAN